MLKVHRERQEQMRSKAGTKWQELGLVFCNQYGRFMIAWHVDILFFQLLEKAGLPKMRFHDLRHGMATVLLAAGIHPKVVQERLGHSSIKITMDVYSHVLPTMLDDVARMLGKMFKDE